MVEIGRGEISEGTHQMPKKHHYLAHPSLVTRAIGGLVLGLAFLAVGIGLATEHNTPAPARPRSGRPPTVVVVDLGAELPGQILERRVLVRNAGPAIIKISRVITSCGCLHTTLQPQLIAPGKAGVLTLQIATRPWAGREFITATVFGCAGSTPIVRRYLVQYTVRRLVRFAGSKDSVGEPYYLDLGAISFGSSPKPFQVSVTRGTYPAHWDAWRCSTSAPGLAAKVRCVGRDSWMLSLIPKGLTILGSQSYRLRFSFYRGDEELPYHYSQPVNFMVRGSVRIEPGSVFFGAVPFGSTVVKHLHLVTGKTDQSGNGRILSVKSTDPKRAAVAITGGGKGLRVTFRAVGTHGQATGRFVVTSEYGGSRYQFRVDYLAYVTAKQGAK